MYRFKYLTYATLIIKPLATKQPQTGLDMSTMDVVVTEMRFDKDSARAAVAAMTDD